MRRTGKELGTYSLTQTITSAGMNAFPASHLSSSLLCYRNAQLTTSLGVKWMERRTRDGQPLSVSNFLLSTHRLTHTCSS